MINDNHNEEDSSSPLPVLRQQLTKEGGGIRRMGNLKGGKRKSGSIGRENAMEDGISGIEEQRKERLYRRKWSKIQKL